MSEPSPRDRFVTVYGRKPVLEALADDRLAVDKLLLADSARGDAVQQLIAAAGRRGVEVRRVPAQQVTRISRNGRHDQGVVADVVAPALRRLSAEVAATLSGPVLVLDGITNPQNVGMILRTATAAGLAGVVLPRVGVADLGPLVIKASAGVAFEAPVLRAHDVASAVELLREGGFRIFGLSSGSNRLLWDARPFPERSAFVLGSETAGLSVAVDDELSIPMAGHVESLNVAVAAGLLCFELVRRQLS
ncbi:MAG: RNA methyltransferase [Actinobacteria bacterium]|nr:RNA methyltransferase [Actinomycetota bacterium]MBW3649632.1 RNA methyltransferase [Actinomycetota bacterium]